MIVSDIQCLQLDSVTRLQARIQMRTGQRRDQVGCLDFHGRVDPPPALGDPFLAACLLSAMFVGEELEVRAPVSACLKAALPKIQEIFRNWYPKDLQRVQVILPQAAPPAPPVSSAAACFFSGGVDSWFSVLKHQPHLRGLITVKGFDIPVHDTTIWPRLRDSNTRVARELGIPLLIVETNLRDCLDPTYPGLGRQFQGDFWGPCLHGGFLGAVGLALQAHFGVVLIPSSFPYNALHPWGSHPLVDPLWAGQGVQFDHDGAEANRVGKIQLITKSPAALRHLRVCPASVSDQYNCGLCEKCLRTRLTLHLFNVPESPGVFPNAFSLELLMDLELAPTQRVWYEEILEAAESQNRQDVGRVCRLLLGQTLDRRRELRKLVRRARSLSERSSGTLGLSKLRRSIQKRKQWIQNRIQPPSASEA